MYSDNQIYQIDQCVTLYLLLTNLTQCHLYSCLTACKPVYGMSTSSFAMQVWKVWLNTVSEAVEELYVILCVSRLSSSACPWRVTSLHPSIHTVALFIQARTHKHLGWHQRGQRSWVCVPQQQELCKHLTR